MDRLHLTFAWSWILAGLLAGTVQGLFFHREDWLGGYASWPRRLTRLGHVSFLGTGLLNLGFALSIRSFGVTPGGLAPASILILSGAITMPPVCYLSAWNKRFRSFFFIPVLCLVAGVTVTVMRILLSTRGAP